MGATPGVNLAVAVLAGASKQAAHDGAGPVTVAA